MRVGVMIQPRALAETRALARLAESEGLDWLGVPDSPAVYEDSFLHQSEALRVTRRLLVGPLVTHFVVRHPLVVANALATLSAESGGRVLAAVGTGNSAARGLGMPPARLRDLGDAITCMRAWWAGERAEYRGGFIPATRIVRRAPPVLLAADGPRGAELAAEVADGFVFGGGLDEELVRSRTAVARRHARQTMWIAPGVSMAAERDEVVRDVGPQMVAMANRALRGDLDDQGVPRRLHDAVRAMRAGYDYGAHADAQRPLNVAVATPALAEYLVDRMVLWGDDRRWERVLDRLAGLCDGVMLVLGQREPAPAVRAIAERLRRLGYLEAVSTS